MKVTYVGRSTTGVELVLPDSTVYVAHGDSVDVPDDIAADLLAQEGQWSKHQSPKKAAPADSPQED